MTLDFDRIKQRDQRYGFTLGYTGYAYDTQGNLISQRPVTLQSFSDVLGSHGSMLYKLSKHYTPNDFRLNPVDQRSIELSCTTCSVDVPVWVKYGAETRVGHRFTNMPIAASMATPLTGMPALSFPSDMGYLLQKAYAKLSEPDVDVGLFFGELTETMKMFTNPIRSMGSLIGRFNRKAETIMNRYKADKRLLRKAKLSPQRRSHAERRIGRKLLDSISNAWLTFWLGVKPLLADIESVREKLQKGFATPFKVHRRVAGKDGMVVNSSARQSWTYRYGLWWENTTQSVTYTKARATVYYYPLPSFGVPLEELGLSVHQLPRLIYNLIPYSFVLNWIVDFDTWLGAISPKYHVAVCGNVKSVSSQTISTFGLSRVWNYGYGPIQNMSSQHVSQAKCYLRDRDYESAMFPMVTEPLKTFERSLTAISLLWQRMPKVNTKVFKELS